MLENENWFDYLSEGQKDLVKQAYSLLEESRIKNKQLGRDEYHDYSFVVFPMAKAYEGFLKKFFLDAGLIDDKTYQGDRFRIGKSLNPDLPSRHRGNWWLYGPLTDLCKGEKMPYQLWRAWKECRNLLFHFFPKHKHFINQQEAQKRVEQIEQAMRTAFSCGLIRSKE